MKRKFIFLINTLFIILLPNEQAFAATENTVKAAFIYQFISHVAWTNENAKSEYSIAIYQGPDFYNEVKELIDGETLKGKELKLTLITRANDLRNFDVVYIPESQNNELDDIAFLLRNTETLLVSSQSENKKNIMINFIDNVEGGSLSFEINKSNILSENLTISADLLLLGGTELDVAILYREIETAMYQMKLRESDLQQRLNTLEENWLKASLLLTESKEQLAINNKELETKKRELNGLYREVEKQKIEISNAQIELTESYQTKERELTEVTNKYQEEIENAQNVLKEKNEDVTQKEQEIALMESTISLNRNRINEQLALLENKQLEISEQENKIQSRNKYLTITTLLIVIFICFSLLVGFLFLRNRKTTRRLQKALSTLKDTQVQLVESEKMASLGLLTAGVAHEINTPLGVIVTSLSIIEDKIALLDKSYLEKNITRTQMEMFINELKETTKISTSSLNRLTTLLKSFKALSIDHAMEDVRHIDVESYIAELMTTLARKLEKRSIDFSLKAEQEIIINTVPGALAQVITNLITNAIDHAFSASESEQANPQIAISLKVQNNELALLFKDNGAGMPIEVLNNIYEPFYTTNRAGGGTGLGMHIVYNTIKQKLKGDILIQSEVNQGTEITITLPLDINNAPSRH